MNKKLSEKSTTEEIRERFDTDVERFTNLETGQSATIDASLAMELITHAAVKSTRPITCVLDIGCGAGNNTLKLREVLGRDFTADLLDLSEPMVSRAAQRFSKVNAKPANELVGDFRSLKLQEKTYDVILAAAVFHHLRDDLDWLTTFQKCFSLLRPGGSIWVSDLVAHEVPSIHVLMWDRYAKYLESLKGVEYRQEVFDYIEKEDSPRPLTYQLDLFRKVGFESVDVLHKNSCFAAFGAIKGA